MHTIAPEAVWRAGSLLPTLPQTTSLDIYNLRAVAPEVQLSVSTLAGLVNRGPAKIYVIASGDDEFWLNEIDPSLPRTTTPVSSDGVLDHLLNVYRAQLKGLVLYDPALSATRNVATTLAALRDGMVVSPEQAAKLQESPYDLPVLADLRTHGWKTPLQAYAWAAKHLLPECSPDLVAGLDPDIRGSLRSFLVAHRAFIYWLDPRKIWPSPALSWLCERGLLKRVLANFPAGAVHMGWFISEPFGIRLTSRAALLTLASDHCTNLEVWSSLPESPAPQEDAPGPVEAPESGLAGHTSGKGELERIYLSFTISDGDNLQYCQHHLLRLWLDEARGTIPLGWTIAPALPQVMPHMSRFYRRTATEQDEFIAGPGGAAYILPSYWPKARRAAFLELTAEYMRAMHLTTLQVLDSRTPFSWFNMRFLNPGLQRSFAEELAPHGLRGIFSGAGSVYPFWQLRVGIPIYQNLGLALDARRALRLIHQAAARGARFINIYILAWNMTPGDLQAIVQQLDARFCVVTPTRLLELIRQEG